MTNQSHPNIPIPKQPAIRRLLAGYWLVFGGLFLIVPADLAFGSCGDYLHHGVAVGGNFLDRSLVGHLPTRAPADHCKNGKCGGQIPINLPTRDKVQVEDRSPVIALIRVQCDFGKSTNVLVVESTQMIQQIFLEVAVPPPRLA